MTCARFADSLDQLFQSRQKTIVADAQQGTTGNVAHAGSFDHQRAWSPGSKPSIPVEVFLSNNAIVRRAPWHHRGHPGATLQFKPSDANRLKHERALGFARCWPERVRNVMTNWILKFPHLESLY